MQNKVLIAVAAVIVVFLVGFLPEYMKAGRVEHELRQARQEAAGAELRDLIGLAYLQASQKNYGLASETATRYFNRAREVAAQDGANRKALEELLASRDKITAELAKGDAAVIGDLQDLFVRTRAATGRQ